MNEQTPPLEPGRLYFSGDATIGIAGPNYFKREAILKCLKNRPAEETDEAFAERLLAEIEWAEKPKGLRISAQNEGIRIEPDNTVSPWGA